MKLIAKILIAGCAGLVLGACNGGGDDNNDNPSLPTNPLISATYQSCVNGVATKNQFTNENGAKTVAPYAAADCSGVNVRILDLDYQWISPIGFGTHAPIPMPGFSTYLPREIMGQDPNSASVCSS